MEIPLNPYSSIISRHRLARLVTSLILLVVIAGAVLPAAAQQPDAAPLAEGIFTGESTAVQFDISPPLRDIPPLLPTELPEGEREIPERASGLEGAYGAQDIDTAVQDQIGPGEIAAPLVSFDSLPNLSSVSPPDPVGDVGPNHYVAMSNLSFQIHSKTGTSLYGPALNNTLWAGFGGDCQTDNSGDPIVLYDQLSDRWLLSQFTASGPTYFVCIAISTTPDPTGPYYRYALSTGNNFPDYPKLAIWPDSVFVSTRDFANGATYVGMGIYAINRSQLMTGNPTPQVISFLVPPSYFVGDGLLPADLDGSSLPPPSSPGYFMGVMDNGGPYGAPQDALSLWKFNVNYGNPGASSFQLSTTIPVAPFDSIFPCTPGSRDCIPQPGTTNKIDILSYRQRLMHRLAYRNFGTHESLVANHSVEASSGMAGVRWYELRSPNSGPSVYQQGTYAPGISDGIHRWMGSIAMDKFGNIGLGYSVSNATSVFPGMRYTGRLAADPLGTMPQGEGTIINGTGSQTGSQRWGDYTSMNIDPLDDCTFWYINQYVPTTSSAGWRLRVGSFRLTSCDSVDLSIVMSSPVSQSNPGSQVAYNLTVSNLSPAFPSISAVLANPGSITINDNLPATPYPSTINASSLQGTIQKVTVTLNNISHTFPDDVDVLLVGPGGQKALLMSDVGGGSDLVNVNLTFDDAAAGSLPDGSQITSGTYKPTDFDTANDTFPAPAPAGPFTASLAVFNGTNPQGTWQLYVRDDVGGDFGAIAGGWSLQFTLAPLITVVDTLPAGMTYDSFVGLNWSCTPSGQIITCLYPAPLIGPAPVLSLIATMPNSSGLFNNQASVSSPLVDPALANNTSNFTILVPWRAFLPLVRR